MAKKDIAFLLVMLLISCCLHNAFAQDSPIPQSGTVTTSTETFLSMLNVDLPPAILTCRTGGSLTQIFSRTGTFKSGGNALFLDKPNREIALFENAVVTDSADPNNIITASTFIKIPDVERKNLVELLLQRRIVATRNAQIILLIKKTTSEGEEVYINEGKAINDTGEEEVVESTIFTLVRKLGNIRYKGQKYVTATGTVKIYFLQSPKKVDASGNLVDVFENLPGSVICNFKGAPIHDYDLTDLKDAFDGGLVDQILQEASSNDDGEFN